MIKLIILNYNHVALFHLDQYVNTNIILLLSNAITHRRDKSILYNPYTFYIKNLAQLVEHPFLHTGG